MTLPQLFIEKEILQAPIETVTRVHINEFNSKTKLQQLVNNHCIEKGTPLVLTGFKELNNWDSELFNLDYLQNNFGDQEIDIYEQQRNKSPIKVTWNEFITRLKQNSMPTSFNYATNINNKIALQENTKDELIKGDSSVLKSIAERVKNRRRASSTQLQQQQKVSNCQQKKAAKTATMKQVDNKTKMKSGTNNYNIKLPMNKFYYGRNINCPEKYVQKLKQVVSSSLLPLGEDDLAGHLPNSSQAFFLSSSSPSSLSSSSFSSSSSSLPTSPSSFHYACYLGDHGTSAEGVQYALPGPIRHNLMVYGNNNNNNNNKNNSNAYCQWIMLDKSQYNKVQYVIKEMIYNTWSKWLYSDEYSWNKLFSPRLVLNITHEEVKRSQNPLNLKIRRISTEASRKIKANQIAIRKRKHEEEEEEEKENNRDDKKNENANNIITLTTTADYNKKENVEKDIGSDIQLYPHKRRRKLQESNPISSNTTNSLITANSTSATIKSTSISKKCTPTAIKSTSTAGPSSSSSSSINNEFTITDEMEYDLSCDYAITMDELKRLYVKPHIIIQRPGDLVFIPRECYYQTTNVGVSLNITWNRINTDSLNKALLIGAKSPEYLKVGPPEKYNCGAAIYYVIKNFVLSDINVPNEGEGDFIKYWQQLIHLYYIWVLSRETIEPIEKDKVSDQNIINDYEDEDNEATKFNAICNFCQSVIFHRYYQCSICNKKLCLSCYLAGRSCKHVQQLVMHQHSQLALEKYWTLYYNAVYKLENMFGIGSASHLSSHSSSSDGEKSLGSNVNASYRLQIRGPLLPEDYSLATSCRRLEIFRGKFTGANGKNANRLLSTINSPFGKLFRHRRYPLKTDERKKT